MPTPEPPLMPRQSSRSRSTSAQPYITATSPTPSEKVRRYRQTEADRAIVAALDARLPRWSGPQPGLPGGVNLCGVDGSGWWGEGAPDYEMNAGGERMWPNRIKGVAEAISGYRDPS